jgi:hypothetical protein
MKRIGMLTMTVILIMGLAGAAGAVEEPADYSSDPPHDPAQSDIWQRYDRFDIGAAYPSFGRVFDVWVSPRVNAAWDSSTMATFIHLVMDEDESNDADIFPLEWHYFCYADSGTVYDGIHINSYEPRDSISLFIYDRMDFSCPPEDPDLCKGYSFYSDAQFGVVLSASGGKRPEEVARDAFAHELQHLCWFANFISFRHRCVYGYRNANESLSMAAEYMWKSWEVNPPNVYDISYDASVFRCERCDPNAKYLVERCWMGYLYEHFRGTPGDPTDDLIYRWIRQEDEDGYGEVTMRSLARVLDGTEYAWIDGTNGDERLATVFQWFLVAKFCDAPDLAPDARFGFREYSPVRVDGWFCDLSPPVPPGHTPQLPVDCPGPTSGCYHLDEPVPEENSGPWNVRILPPSYELGVDNENVTTEVSGIYRDGDDTPADTTDGDKSRDYIDVALYGTDYIIFKAGDFFQDGDAHEFRFSFQGVSPAPPLERTAVKAWAIGYSSSEDTLQLHPEDIVFIEPIPVHPHGTNGRTVVSDFGRRIKSVVVAITLVETTPEEHSGGLQDEYFTYRYEYGVYEAIVPAHYALEHCYPNPFNPVAAIGYEVPSPGDVVSMSIYDVRGRLVKLLFHEPRNAGSYTAYWDGRNSDGDAVASGVYFVRMRAGAFEDTIKIVLLR